MKVFITELQGKNIMTADGKYLGQVDNVVVDTNSGELQHLLVIPTEEIDIRVDAALKRFEKEIAGGSVFLEKAKGVLVLPKVLKAGFGIGGEYGEGALRIDGKTVEYYSIASASIGFQIGAQSKKHLCKMLNIRGVREPANL